MSLPDKPLNKAVDLLGANKPKVSNELLEDARCSIVDVSAAAPI